MSKMIYHTLQCPGEKDRLGLKKHTNVYSYELSGSNSVEATQLYDFVFSILVITVAHVANCDLSININPPFQFVKGQIICC